MLGVEQPILVGTSSGGLIAMHCAARHPSLVGGLVLDSTLGVPTTLDETLEVFARKGGPVAREAARRYLGGDMTPAAALAWETHALPVYGHDPAPRRERALMNDDVQTHFRTGGCGPADAAVRTHVLPGIGHGVFRQAPEQSFALVRAFLGGQRAGPSAGAASGRRRSRPRGRRPPPWRRAPIRCSARSSRSSCW